MLIRFGENGGDIQEGELIMFWEKDKNVLPGPKSLPNAVYREIVTRFRADPDEAWNDFKAVVRPKDGVKDIFEVRVFNGMQASSGHVSIKDYNSLDEHPELILYEGWFNKGDQAEIQKKM